MPIYLWEDKVLTVDGKVAGHEECCCSFLGWACIRLDMWGMEEGDCPPPGEVPAREPDGVLYYCDECIDGKVYLAGITKVVHADCEVGAEGVEDCYPYTGPWDVDRRTIVSLHATEEACLAECGEEDI